MNEWSCWLFVCCVCMMMMGFLLTYMQIQIPNPVKKKKVKKWKVDHTTQTTSSLKESRYNPAPPPQRWKRLCRITSLKRRFHCLKATIFTGCPSELLPTAGFELGTLIFLEMERGGKRNGNWGSSFPVDHYSREILSLFDIIILFFGEKEKFWKNGFGVELGF